MIIPCTSILRVATAADTAPMHCSFIFLWIFLAFWAGPQPSKILRVYGWKSIGKVSSRFSARILLFSSWSLSFPFHLSLHIPGRGDAQAVVGK